MPSNACFFEKQALDGFFLPYYQEKAGNKKNHDVLYPALTERWLSGRKRRS